MSLPGGAVEPGEASAAAAIREFHEELGDDGQPIDLLGSLSPLYVRASNYLVTPWVATVPARPQLTPNPAEVEEVLEVPLTHLLDPAHFGSHTRQHEGRSYDPPHFLVGSHPVWGATCMILGELVTLLEEMSWMRVVVFDMDGLMINTEDLYTMAGTELLRRRGHQFTEELKHAMMGLQPRPSFEILIRRCHLERRLGKSWPPNRTGCSSACSRDDWRPCPDCSICSKPWRRPASPRPLAPAVPVNWSTPV